MTRLKTALFGLFFAFSWQAYTQQRYIPESANSLKTAEVFLEYYSEPNANRPWAMLKFKDDLQMTLNTVCAGEFAWCIRAYEGEQIIELGTLKIEFMNHEKSMIVKKKLAGNNLKYRKYLVLIAGRYKKV